MDLMMRNLRKLDAYPKINKDFYSRTISGGIITLVSAILMLILFISELMSLDEMDTSGEQHFDLRHDIIKKRIDAHGNVIEAWQDGIGAPTMEKPLQRQCGRLEHNETYCGSCYGAEASDEDCCNSCEEVREAYQKKEGFLKRIKDEEGERCNIYGFLEVNKFREAAERKDDDVLLKAMSLYGEEVVEALGSEVDRLEKEIQKIVPGIRHVDIEAHNPKGPSP